MLNMAVAHALDPETSSAAAQLVEQARAELGDVRPQAGIVYTAMGIDHLLLMRLLAEAMPGVELIGCTTDGEITGCEGFHEDSTVLVLFGSDQVSIRAGLGRDVGRDAAAAAQQAVRVARREGDGDPRLCIALPDGLSVSGTVVTAALREALGPDVVLVGGTAGDQRVFERSLVMFGDEVVEDGVALLLVSGEVQVGVGIGSGWRPVGTTTRVTASTGNVVQRIGEHTALGFYQRYMGEHVVPDPEYPLGVHDPASGRFFLRAPLVVNHETGEITFAGDLPVGSEVQITEARRDEILAGCRASVQSALADLGDRTPEGALVFSCAARRLVLGTQTAREIDEVFKALEIRPPIAGFYTYGEIAPLERGGPSLFHNETFVTVFVAAS